MKSARLTSILFLAPLLAAAQIPAKQDDLAAKGVQVDELLGKRIKVDMPGAAVLVVQDGKKLVNKGYGLANLKEKSPITPDTVFELASCSKQFTAMAVMMLAERGKLDYGDTLSKFFPKFTPSAGRVTVEQLLHHTAGLPDYMDAWTEATNEIKPTSHVMLNLLTKKRLLFQPGSKYDYSNSGYMVLAQIVEKASDKKFPEFVRANIFAPLGMTHSLVFDETKPHIVNRAHCYAHVDDNFKDTSDDELNNVYGDGSVRASINDLFLWDQALYTEKLVHAATLEKAFISGKTKDGEETGYGFGWKIDDFHGAKSVSHDGLWLNFNTEILRIPEKHFTAIVLSNVGKFPSGNVAEKIACIYLLPKEKPK